jgi:hypothetical protein
MKSLSYLMFGAVILFSARESPKLQSDVLISHHVNAKNEEAEIKAIRDEYNRINKLPLKSEIYKYKTNDCVEGGEVTYYSNNGQVVKVSEKGAMDDTVWRREYYYLQGKVIFCLESLEWGSAAGPVTTTEYRFYIKGGKSIREISNNKIEALTEKAAETVAVAGKLLKVKASKNFASVYCE